MRLAVKNREDSHRDTKKNQKTLCLCVSVRKFFVDLLQMAEVLRGFLSFGREQLQNG